MVMPLQQQRRLEASSWNKQYCIIIGAGNSKDHEQASFGYMHSSHMSLHMQVQALKAVASCYQALNTYIVSPSDAIKPQ